MRGSTYRLFDRFPLAEFDTGFKREIPDAPCPHQMCAGGDVSDAEDALLVRYARHRQLWQRNFNADHRSERSVTENFAGSGGDVFDLSSCASAQGNGRDDFRQRRSPNPPQSRRLNRCAAGCEYCSDLWHQE